MLCSDVHVALVIGYESHRLWRFLHTKKIM